MQHDRNRPSLSFAVGERTPMQREINDAINAQFEGVARGDLAGQGQRRQAIMALLDEFDRADGDGHSNPQWIRLVMRANVHNAFGELEDALRLESQAEQFAADDRQFARNYNNLSEYYRRSGRYKEALDYAKKAYELWPENDGMIVNLALCFYKSGMTSAARQLLVGLAKALPELGDPRNILAAYASFDEECREMVQNLISPEETSPEVRALRDLA